VLRRWIMAAVAVFTLGAPGFVGAQTNAVRQYDESIASGLGAHNPGLARLWLAAARASYRNERDGAARLYERMLAIDPSCAPALWAYGGLAAGQGDRVRGLALARQAVSADPSPASLSALALILAPDRKHASAAEISEAYDLAKQASARVGASAGVSPEGLWAELALCKIALLAGDLQEASAVAGRLLRQDGPEVAFCIGSYLQASGQPAAAAGYLERARVLGKSEAAANRAALESGGRDHASAGRDERARREPRPRLTMLGLLKWTIGLWVGSLALLLVAGLVLSRAVLRTAEDLARRARSARAESGAGLKRAYATVLWSSCAYYYASIPLLALLTVTLGGGILYAMFAVGRVPIKLALIVLVVTCATVVSILKSLFVRRRDDDPGERLPLRAHPRLRAVLEEVARRIETRPVDSVYLTPGTEVAVLERGGLGRQLRGRTERCLVLGLGVLDGLRIGPLKAVLAHEYGHFSNRDTAGGGFALSVRASLVTMATSLAESGAATWYNPVWIFLNGYYRVFLRISLGASRLQEILADRGAVLGYGSKAFEEGLRHVVARSIRFDAAASQALVEMAHTRTLTNLYAPGPDSEPPAPEIDRAIREALSRRPSPYDSHPSPIERTRWARALGSKGAGAGGDDEQEAWTLFADPLAVQQAMTEKVRRAIMQRS
jgi:Zn-dependent protease with chaperone function